MIGNLIFFSLAPPNLPIIRDEHGREVSSVLGPLVEGQTKQLLCIVTGGKIT